MTVVLDTSVLLALLNRRDPAHEWCVRWWAAEQPTVRTTPLVLAEADHLLAVRAGTAGTQALRAALAAGEVKESWWDGASSACASVAERYAGLSLGLTDASLVVLARREGTQRLATLDERHFRVVRPLDGAAAFTLLPSDG